MRCRAFIIVCGLLVTSATHADSPARAGFDGLRAFKYLEEICAIGPRISGTPGMTRQQEIIERHFVSLGADVRYQDFDASHPQTGQPVRMRNMLISWNPRAVTRSLLCCHYDTRPRPDQEPVESQKNMPFVGANDGGSGVAMLMELGNVIATLEPRPPMDFIIFDGEELVYERTDKYFLGSEYFATSYRDRIAGSATYSQGILLDMVAGKNATFYFEGNSIRFAPEVTRNLWDIARRRGVKEFVNKRKHEVLDDHLPLNQIAGIPTCDVIDFDYPYWHRRNDLPAACSAATIQKVGGVLVDWIQSLPASR